MPIDKLPEESLEYYDNPMQLIEEEDIIETDVHVLGWRRKFRIRALTFGQMDKINKSAQNKEGELQADLFVYHTIVEGVVRPKFKIEQAQRLAESNGACVQELSDEIWRLGRISKELWDQYIEELKHQNKLDKGDFSGEVEQKPV